MQDQVLTSWPVGRPGRAYDMEPKADVQMINKNPATAEVRSIVVDTAVGSLTTYAWTLLGVAQSVASASSDKAVIAALIVTRILNDPLTGGYVIPVSDGVDTITLTYRDVGVSFPLTDADSNLTTALVTAADSADPVSFGSILIRDNDDLGVFDAARLAAVAGLGAMSYDLTPVQDNDAMYHVSVRFNDMWYHGEILAGSAATVDAIVDDMVARLNTVFPTNSVLAAADTATATKMILTSEIAGMPIQEVKAWGSTETAVWTVARSDAFGAFADIDQALAGIALEDQRVPGDVGTTNLSYPGASAMTVRRQGAACVLVQDAAVDQGDEVWIGVGTGHEGLVRTSASGANYARSKRLAWRGRAGTYQSLNCGWLEVLKAA